MFKRIQYIDDLVINWIGRLHTPILNKIMVVISQLGTKGAVWLLLCIPFMVNPSTLSLIHI